MKQTIGTVARALGLKPKTIRYYEQIGIVPPPSREGTGWLSAGRRLYGDKEIERLRFVKEARRLDFPLDDIRQLLEGYENGPPCGCAARPLLKTVVERKLNEIEEALKSLEALRGELNSLYARVLALEGKTPADLLERTLPTPADALLSRTSPSVTPAGTSLDDVS